MKTRALQVLLVVSLVGCSAARLAAKKGEEALARGDSEAALGHYWSACRQSDDAEWCAASDQLYDQLLPGIVATASATCGQRGQERNCFDALSRLRRFKDEPRLSALADAAGKTWLDACRQTSVQTPVDALVRVRCVEVVRRDVMTPAYERQVSEERSAMAAFVTSESGTASSRGYVASSYGLGELARCFSGQRPARLTELGAAAIDRLQLKATAAGDGVVDARWACDALASESAGRIVCGANAVLGLRVGLTRGPVVHTFSDETSTVSYVAERRQYENPEWLRLEEAKGRAEHRARRTRHEAKLAADQCQNARSEHARASSCQECEEQRVEERLCRHADTLAGFASEASGELDSVTSRLRCTERTLVEEIKADYRSVERTHVWTQPYRLSIAAEGAVLRAHEDTFEVARRGLERAAFAPAGISPSIAVPPSQSTLDSEAIGELRGAFATWVHDAQSVYARAREVECSAVKGNPAGQVECRTSVAYLRGEEPARAYLAVLGAMADARSPYPAASCAR